MALDVLTPFFGSTFYNTCKSYYLCKKIQKINLRSRISKNLAINGSKRGKMVKFREKWPKMTYNSKWARWIFFQWSYSYLAGNLGIESEKISSCFCLFPLTQQNREFYHKKFEALEAEKNFFENCIFQPLKVIISKKFIKYIQNSTQFYVVVQDP